MKKIQLIMLILLMSIIFNAKASSTLNVSTNDPHWIALHSWTLPVGWNSPNSTFSTSGWVTAAHARDNTIAGISTQADCAGNLTLPSGASVNMMWWTNSTPAGADDKAIFRDQFTLGTCAIIDPSSFIEGWADDEMTVWVNGIQIGHTLNSGVTAIQTGPLGFDQAAFQAALVPGVNVIAVKANDLNPSSSLACVGFALNAHIVFTTGTPGHNLAVNTCSNFPQCEALVVGGSVLVDANGDNIGTFNDALKFGGCGTGEAIGSKRNSGGNQWGLDFYTDFTNRMSISNQGLVGIGTSAPQQKLHLNDGALLLSCYPASDEGILFQSIPPVAGLGAWGLQYADLTSLGGDKGLNFWKPGVTNNVLFLDDNLNIGIGTGKPTAQLHTTGSVRLQGLTQSTTDRRIIVSDNNGNLFWANPDVVSFQIGGPACAASSIKLTSNREVPLNNYHINFTDQLGSYEQGQIGIGIPCGQKPAAKLDIYRPEVSDDNSPVGLNVLNHDNGATWYTGTAVAIGVSATADNGYNGTNIGVSATAEGASAAGSFNGIDIGTMSTADAQGQGNAYGGWFTANNGGYNVGIYASNNSLGSPANPYGHVATGSSSDCAAIFDGDIFSSTGVMYSTSDEKLKTNIKQFENGLALLKKLNAKTYDFKTEEYKNSMNLPKENQIGIMAQNMQAVFPNLVKEKIAPSHRDPNTHQPLGSDTRVLAVNYIGLIPVLVEAVNELNSKTDSIIRSDSVSILQTALANTNADLAITKAELANTNTQITRLQSQIDDLCSGGCAGLKGSNSNDGSSGTGNILLQNVPNPFSQQTTIGYVVNVGTTAYMNINSLDGKTIKHINLAVNGAGTVTISSNEMTPGTYTYTLVVDTKVVDTKIMVITAQD